MRPYRRKQGVIKALRILKIMSNAENHDYINEFQHGNNWTKKLVNTRCRCSCSACGNPRHIKWLSHDEQITMQERKSDISFKEQIDESVLNSDEDEGLFSF